MGSVVKTLIIKSASPTSFILREAPLMGLFPDKNLKKNLIQLYIRYHKANISRSACNAANFFFSKRLFSIFFYAKFSRQVAVDSNIYCDDFSLRILFTQL